MFWNYDQVILHVSCKEKADLHQRAQVLELQLKRAKQGSDGCEVRETVLMKEDSEALREVESFIFLLSFIFSEFFIK